MNDTRNVADEFKGLPHDDIVCKLDSRGVSFEIARENTLRDFNMGSIVRSANAFGVRQVHVVGRRQWNKRGAMMTDSYLSMRYHDSIDAFVKYATENSRPIIAIDNVDGAVNLADAERPSDAILLFGQEGPGLSNRLLECAQTVVAIEQQGSTRSINVAAAAAIVMYEWLRSGSN